MFRDVAAAKLQPPAPPTLGALEQKIRLLLHGRVQGFRLTIHGDGVALTGSAPTYYVKQLAQHLVMQHCDLQILRNGIEVV
jgi:hypothetical protein